MSPRKTAAKQTEAIVPAGPALVVDNKLNFAALENGERKTIEQLDAQVRQGITNFKNSVLMIGEGLVGIHAILEPRRAYTAYLNTVGIPRSSANRAFNAFKYAKENLPDLILAQALASGMQMVGNEEEPYGRYTKIINKLKLPHGILTPERAREWIEMVQEKYRAQQKLGRRKTPDQLLDKAYRSAVQAAHRVPQETQITWVGDLLTKVAKDFGLQIHVTVAPSVTAAEKATAAATQLDTVVASAQPAPKARHATMH